MKPPPTKAPPDAATLERIVRVHDTASARGQTGYIDPSTGLLVLTAFYLRARAYCCGAGCRHCPYSEEEQAAAGRPEESLVWYSGDRA